MGASYSVYETKTRLSEILRAVRRGTPATITDRHKPVARIVRLEEASDDDAHYRALETAGVIQPGRHAWPRRLPPLVDNPNRRPGALKRFLAERHRY